MISRQTLVSFFEDTRRLREDGKARFDIDSICRWSYFFVANSKADLQPLAEHLMRMGYEFKGYLPPDSADDLPGWFLQMDRIERHTVDSLDARNIEFSELVEVYKIESYDGMDVGEIDDQWASKP